MKELLKAILVKLLTVDGIRHADRYNAQPEFLTGEVVFDLPACFVEIASVEWSDKPYLIQEGQARVRVHIVQNTLADSYEGSEDQATALAIEDTIRRVYVALHDWVPLPEDAAIPISSSKMRRVTSISDTRHDVVSVDILEFNLTVVDYSASPDFTRSEEDELTSTFSPL